MGSKSRVGNSDSETAIGHEDVSMSSNGSGMKPGPSASSPRRASLPAWSISLLFHLAVLLLMFCFASKPGTGLWGEGEEVERELIVQLDGEPPRPEPAAPPNRPAEAEPAKPPPADAARQLDQAFERRLQEEGSRNTPTPGPSLPGRLDPFESPLGDLKAAGTLPQMPLPGNHGVETDFFGARSKGARFVYVIDRSASMGRGLNVAKTELLASLEKLPPTAQFQVIAYDLDQRLLDGVSKGGLLPATRENKDRTARFLEPLRSEGGTDHVRALRKALTLTPQVIYFLTDADELRPEEVRELTLLNQRGANARIFCIELSTLNENRTNNPMRLLAQENRGLYRGIDLARFLERVRK